MPPTIWTCGYEPHRTLDSLIATLKSAGVQRVVDVRELPLSRRRGFSKTALRESLECAAIAYDHARALGNPKAFRDLYRSGDVASGEAAFRQHVRNGSAWAVDELLATVLSDRTSLLCWERDPEVCHRAVVVEELQLRCPELRVVHLR